MNFIDAEIEKMQRRIKRIEDNPDPTKLKATRMLYELELGLRLQQRDAWKAGKHFVFGLPGPSLVKALGLDHLDLHQAADRVSDATKYFEVLRATGYPDHHCDRTVVGVGMVLAGDMPLPHLTVAVNNACDPIMLMGHAIGHHLSPLSFLIDIDSATEEPSEEFLGYLTAQLEEFIGFVQEKIPGTKFDPDKMAELQEWDRQANEYLKEIHEFRKRVPCPVNGQDVFRIPRQPSLYADPVKAVEYFRVLRDEIGEKVEKGYGAVKEEKLRVMWTITAPYFSNVFQALEERGASVVHFQIGGAARMFGHRGFIGDETEFGRKLPPLEEYARMMTFNGWAGLASRWVNDTLAFAEELRCDAIINFEQWGCVAAVLTRKILADRAEKELGIPCLFLEGRNLDKTTFSEEDFRNSLETFIDSCLERKGLS